MDPIADMLTSIRNGLAVQKESLSVPFSALKYEIANILTKKGFIKEARKKGRGQTKSLEIILKYEQAVGQENKKNPAIVGLKKISKPGQRIYKGFRDLKPVMSGYGIAIVSTSKGLMTDKEARKQKLGGEIIAEIW